MKKHLSLIFATVFYIGKIPGPRGTYASVVTSLAYYGFYRIFHRIAPELHLSLLGLITVLGVLSAAEVGRQLSDADPQIVVIDEVAGQLLTFLFLPMTYMNCFFGTLLFRIFDIWKPHPIRWSESLPNGVGIMADDLLAGVYANILLQVSGWMLGGTIPFAVLWMNQ